MKFCPHCGKKLQFENADICPECGCRIAEQRGAMGNAFNIVIILILIAISGVICLIAASVVFSAQFTAEKITTVRDMSDSSLPDLGDSSLTVAWISMDDWKSWEHRASWSGREVGPCTEYGPRIVAGHGEYGANVSLLAALTDSEVWRTFADTLGDGWNTLTFSGKLSPSDVPGGRWLKIEVNDRIVYQDDVMQSPPGNGEFFSIPVHFPQTRPSV